MIPVTLSASSIHVADLCMKRWEAEYANRSRGLGNDAANLGSVCHAALEDHVKECYIDKTQEASLERLLAQYRVYFISSFGDTEHEFYDDGVQMITVWFNRTDLSDVEVLDVENKKSFELPTSAGPIQFNYIFDRFDKLAEGQFKVVDYKTIRWAYPPEDLHKKVQPRSYALAAAIELKKNGITYDRIKIEFDLLRHERIGTWFTYKENHQTWLALIAVAEKIIATPTGAARATLNEECGFCPIKAKCPELQRSISLGGSIGMETEQLVDIRAQMEWQKKAVNNALAEIDDLLMTRAKEADTLEFSTANNKMTVTVSATRTVDADLVEQVIGSDMFTRYGGRALTMGAFDRLIKDPKIPDDQKVKLRSLIGRKIGEPRIKVESNGFI